MEFNWSTFFLELINFLVLVWLIKHFFYKPVCDVIDKRRSAIDEQLASAKSIQSDAESQKAFYENRLTTWEEEKQQQQAQLSQEIEEQKKQRLALLEKQIVEEKRKNASILDKKQQLLQQKIERQAIDQGIRFTAKLLEDLSSQELENKLVDLFLKNISYFTSEQKQSLLDTNSDDESNISIISAYLLSQTQKENLQDSMQKLFERDLHFDYKVDPEIIAGLRVNAGSYVIRANLADELTFFSDSSNGY